MKRLLIIGAGIGQINIVKLAKSMGVYVAVVSPKGYPAIELADELFECDIYDYERIVNFARLNRFTAVTSDQNDLMMPTVAYVAEKLGLPGNTFNQVNSYCDKNNFRKVCSKARVPVPVNIEVHDSNMPSFEAKLPWIVKPSASHMAFGSIRMEPVFFALGQVAGAAAALSLDSGCAAQDLEYAKLREVLLAEGQVIERGAK